MLEWTAICPLLAGDDDGDLTFEVKLLLAADVERAFERVIGGVEAGGEVAALHEARLRKELIGSECVVDGEARRQRVHLDDELAARLLQRLARLGRDERHRLAEKHGLAAKRHDQILVLDRRPEAVVAGDVRRRQHRRDAGNVERRRDVQPRQPPVRQRAADDTDDQLAREGRKVVEELRLAADVRAGRVVGDVLADGGHEKSRLV